MSNNEIDILQKQIDELNQKMQGGSLPAGLQEKAGGMIERLERMAKFGTYSVEYENTSRYIDLITEIPWETRTQDNFDIRHTREVLDVHQYGLESVKVRILEYLAVLQLHRQKEQLTGEKDTEFRAPVLMLVGLAGTGKTSFAYAVGDALGREVARIPFGGMGSALTLRGQSRAFADAEPGAVMKSLLQVKTRNPVLLLDEIDRVSEDARADIMGVLLELLDPKQHIAFRDHYIDYPFDLSDCLFIATGNNTTNISTAVLDRLEVIQMPSYTDEEKIIIASRYVFPKAMTEAGLPPNSIIIDPTVWPQVVRPLGFDSGIRTLERTLQGLCRKVARMIVEGSVSQVVVDASNVKEFLPTW